MTNYIFWKKISNYSTFVCGIVLIIKMFFRKYVESIIVPILFVGGIALIILVVSEVMKFRIKRK